MPKSPEHDVPVPLSVVEVEMSPKAKLLASAAISVFLYTSVLMACPWPQAQSRVQRFLKPTLPVLDNLGIRHRLRLFAPTPPLWTGKLLFRVTFADGTSSFWSYPRSVLSPGDPPDSYNRYLFLALLWGFSQKAPVLFPEFARYVARENYGPGREPVTVEMIERYAAVNSMAYGIGKPPPGWNHEVLLYRYDVAKHQTLKIGRPVVW